MATNWVRFNRMDGGYFTGAALVFGYIGFDAVSTVAEETKNPTRDLPLES
jgi:APA family basic amino acid/polyamine antiporter